MDYIEKTFLLKEGLADLSCEQIQTAIKESIRQKLPVHQCIYNLGFSDEHTLLTAAANAVGVDFLETIDIDSEFSSSYQDHISANSVLPGWLQSISRFFPLTHSLDAARRSLLTGASFGQVRNSLLILLAFTVILIPVTIFVNHVCMNYAKRRGAFSTH